MIEENILKYNVDPEILMHHYFLPRETVAGAFEKKSSN
jgi:hypothetical protein